MKNHLAAELDSCPDACALLFLSFDSLGSPAYFGSVQRAKAQREHIASSNRGCLEGQRIGLSRVPFICFSLARMAAQAMSQRSIGSRPRGELELEHAEVKSVTRSEQ